MNGIRIKNMRSLVDTDTIDLKPINMLVGNNSSGKSTFLRVFPLLKQSFYKKINGPILWAGDNDDYVDFGSYKETVNKNSKEDFIQLEFSIKYDVNSILERMRRYTILEYNQSKYKINEEAKLVITITHKKNDDIVSEIKVICNEDEIKINRENDKKYYNGIEIERDEETKRYKENYRNFMNDQNNILNAINDTFTNRDLYNKLAKEIFKKQQNEPFGLEELYGKEILNNIVVEMHLNKKIKIEESFEKIEKEILKNNQNIRNIIKNSFKINTEIQGNVSIRDKLNIIYVSEVAKYCAEYIENYFLNVNYIKPVRAHAERYYRLINLSVYQIDSDGTNLPIFINSLTKNNLQKYNDWIYEYFKFRIIPKQTDGHVSINIEKDNKEINLSDTGYGYSQLLPIITQLWVILNMQTNSKHNVPIVLAIEQPELHLHPCLQAKLIDVIAKVTKNHKGKIQFILETHSETMINRFGNLIYKHKISENDINVIMFEKEIGEEDTQIRISRFNEEGYLKDWPIGFFAVDDIE